MTSCCKLYRTIPAVAAAISDSAHHVYSYFTIRFSLTNVPTAIASECSLVAECIPIEKQHIVPITAKKNNQLIEFLKHMKNFDLREKCDSI